MIVLNICFKELRFSLHGDAIVLVDFQHVLGSIEGRFISVPNPFKQTLGLLCCTYSFANPYSDVFRLGMFGMRWYMFVNKGGQGSVILFVESIGFLGQIID